MSKQYAEIFVPVTKVDVDERMVFGWGQLLTKNGEEIYDTDNQAIPKDVAFKAWLEYAKGQRVLKQMHAGTARGIVPFIFPVFGDVMKSLGIDAELASEGIAVGAFIEDDETLAKFDSGEFSGFSIGGSAVWEDVE